MLSICSGREWCSGIYRRRGSHLDPRNVTGPFRIGRDLVRQRVRVLPLADFGMPVRKGKSASAVVVVGGHISPKLSAVQEHEEIAVVDAVGMLVQKYKGFCRGRSNDLRIFSECK